MAHKRNRAGRKRKQGHREPNGRLQRLSPEKEARQIRETVIEARMRVFDVLGEHADKQESGSSLGRAFLNQVITWHEFQAGLIAGEVAAFYYRMKGLPPVTPQAFDMFRVMGFSGYEPSARTVKCAIDDYERLKSAMIVRGMTRNASQRLVQDAVFTECNIDKEWSQAQKHGLAVVLNSIAEEFHEHIVQTNVENSRKNPDKVDDNGGSCH